MKLTFPYVFAGVLILVTGVLVAVVAKPQSAPSVNRGQSSAEARETYEVAVRHIIGDYERDAASQPKRSPTFAATAENKLLELAVPAEFRGIHLDLVLALHALADAKPAKRAEGGEHLAELKAENAWMR